eukprot:TRINITY_DN5959_c0_g1_i2.p1 TRINITY_DN5959_c0_g1~~TRINITY_DN5959_c0_g1_i2.p1  ORF type:complete len:200 (-),score=15.31 TRINITY_DN5959_c0_g1_i2:65-664(-)
MIRRPPRSTLSSSSAASDVYKRQPLFQTYQSKPQLTHQFKRPRVVSVSKYLPTIARARGLIDNHRQLTMINTRTQVVQSACNRTRFTCKCQNSQRRFSAGFRRLKHRCSLPVIVLEGNHECCISVLIMQLQIRTSSQQQRRRLPLHQRPLSSKAGRVPSPNPDPVSYTHLRAHETPEHLVCRLLLEKKKKKHYKRIIIT